MNHSFFHKTAAVLIALIVAGGNFVAFAKVGNDFSAPFGLLVHNENKNQPVSRIKGLESLLHYFKKADIKTSPQNLVFADIDKGSRAEDVLSKACQLGILDCKAKHFYPYDDLSINDFVTWFFRTRYSPVKSLLSHEYPDIKKEATRAWLEARRLNLVSGQKLTTQALQEFFYRHSVSEANEGLPYDPALVMSQKEINADNYHSLKEIEANIESLDRMMEKLGDSKILLSKEKRLKERLGAERKAFLGLKASLSEKPYLLTLRPELDPQVAKLVGHFGLQESIYRYSYDYSKNPAYRKYNLTTGILKLHGKLLMPGEILDYWKLISDKSLHDFKYGWVIANGQEEWQFGGGICGSATLAFIPMWKAGLEVLERRNHSLFYSSLYPKTDIGLDATVYRPKPNLKIRNNFDSPLVFNVIDDKEKQVVTIEIFGNRSYKSTVVEGPIFVKRNVVKWIRHLEGFDGTMVSEALESRYNAIY